MIGFIQILTASQQPEEAVVFQVHGKRLPFLCRHHSLHLLYSTFKRVWVWITYQGTYLEKMPWLPYHTFHIVIMMTKPQTYSTAATQTPKTLISGTISVSPGTGQVHCQHTTGIRANHSLINNKPKYITQMGSPLLRRAGPHILWERAPKEKQLSLQSIFWDFSHRHDDSTQGQPHPAS